MIIHIDDDKDALLLMSLVFSEQQMSVQSFSDVQQAMPAVTSGSADVVVCDVHLTESTIFDHPELFHRDNCKVVCISADDSVETRLRARAMGAADFIVKPTSWKEIIYRVKSLQ